ncbi:MAG: hypothetical protein HOY69_24645 [Streptomyces sp.]|nr:hypothetical protein [Streptomyces sp.]
MSIDIARLRPAYNGTAIAAGAIAAPHWANTLNSIATAGDGRGPLAATAIAAGAAFLADRTMPNTWVPRAWLATALIAPACSLTAARPIVAFLTGGTL